MIKRILAVLAVALVVAAMAAVMAIPAMAAPITCPSGQTVTKTGPGTFECVNNGDNTSNAGRHQGTGAKL